VRPPAPRARRRDPRRRDAVRRSAAVGAAVGAAAIVAAVALAAGTMPRPCGRRPPPTPRRRPSSGATSSTTSRSRARSATPTRSPSPPDAGTVTDLPDPGTVIRRGQSLYDVNGPGRLVAVRVGAGLARLRARHERRRGRPPARAPLGGRAAARARRDAPARRRAVPLRVAAAGGARRCRRGRARRGGHDRLRGEPGLAGRGAAGGDRRRRGRGDGNRRVAGLYPALRAARLSPTDALRSV
jgi:hypothetical protein